MSLEKEKLEALVNKALSLVSADSAVRIAKGWSADIKYRLISHAGPDLLLRISSLDVLGQAGADHALLAKLQNLDLPVPKPLEFRVDEELGAVCSILTWLEGEDADRVAVELPLEEQYKLGLQAGQLLRKIHSLPAPSDCEPWAQRFSRKVSRNIAAYQRCGLSFSGGEQMISFVQSRLNLLGDRPQCMHHGDYHIGNMVISKSNKLGIIDFNRTDFGDPIDEFNRIIFTAEVSPAFASGQINGWLDGEPSEDFFELLTFYIASNCLSAVPWSLSFGEEETASMLRRVEMVSDWFAGMERVIPTWYSGQRSV